MTPNSIANGFIVVFVLLSGINKFIAAIVYKML